jgi:hypothetical protein
MAIYSMVIILYSIDFMVSSIHLIYLETCVQKIWKLTIDYKDIHQNL